MKDLFKKRYKFITFLALLNTALLVFDFKYYRVVSSDHQSLLIPLIIGQFIVEAILVLVYAFMKRKECKPELIFIALFIPLGLFQIFVTPLNQAPDERGHLFRAYDLSKGIRTPKRNAEGQAVSDFPIEGVEALYLWQDDHHQYDRTFGQMLKSESGATEEWDYSNTTGYSPFSYIPHILGFWIGRFLNLPFVLQIYLGRIFALLASAILLFFAIKFMPRYKEFFILIALLPRAIQSSMIYSSDGLLNATVLLFIALVFRLVFDGKIKQITAKQLLPIIITGVFFTILKHFAYFPIILLTLLIPTKKFSRRWYKYGVIVAIIILSYFGGKLFMPVSAASAGTAISSGGGIFGMFKFNLARLSVMSFGTFFGIDLINMIKHFLGNLLSFGGVDTATSFYTFAFIVLFVMLLVRNVEEFRLKKVDKMIIWATPILITCIFYYVAMVQWNDYIDHYRGIGGVGGRYFIPLVPLIPFMIHPKKPYTKEKLSIDYVFLFSIFFEACIICAKIVYNI